MTESLRELPIPHSVNSDPKAVELLRVWAAHGQQHVSLASSVWDDPAAWGIMLVDLARHVANTYSPRSQSAKDEILQRIRLGFDAEWDAPTDLPSGGLVE